MFLKAIEDTKKCLCRLYLSVFTTLDIKTEKFLKYVKHLLIYFKVLYILT